jgi:hypothetical protein
MTRFILTLAVTVLLGGVALADCRARARVVVQQKVVEVVPVIATFVPIAVAVPQYSISYTGQPPAAPAKSETDLLKEKIDALQKQLDALKKPTVPVMPPADAAAPPPVQPFLAIMQKKCSACHEAAVAKEKGGDLTLLVGGNLADLSDKRVCKLPSAVYTQRMPKKGDKLTDEEVAVLMEWFDSRK